MAQMFKLSEKVKQLEEENEKLKGADEIIKKLEEEIKHKNKKFCEWMEENKNLEKTRDELQVMIEKSVVEIKKLKKEKALVDIDIEQIADGGAMAACGMLEEENKKLKEQIKNQEKRIMPFGWTEESCKNWIEENQELKEEIKNVKRSKVTGKRLSKEDKELMKKIIDDVESYEEAAADSDDADIHAAGNYDIKLKLLKRLIS